MADAEKILEAKDLSEMPAERVGGKGKWIKGADALGWGMRKTVNGVRLN